MDEKEREEKFINGYNDGYLLSRFEPDLLKKMNVQTPKDNPYFEGFTSGQRAHQREVFFENLERARALTQQQKPRMR